GGASAPASREDGARATWLLLSAAPVAAEAVAAAGRGTVVGLDRALERLDEPRVDGRAVTDGGGLDPLLEALGQPQRDPGREGLVDRLRDAAVLADEHQLGVAAGDADLDVRPFELAVELERGFGEDVLEPPRERRLDRNREEVRRTRRRLVAERRDSQQILPERLDVTVDLHAATMTSL